ncbi:MAG: hypothetical protein KC419_08650, partial [Anaerolineales bacterium]|nr:hypothetical protein [Anaerolineales bacterium]
EAEKQVDPRKLLRALIDLFNENDLRDFCFELTIDYENLPPGGKKDKARELISYFSRRNRLNYLVSVFQELRPQVTLDDIVLQAGDEDPTKNDITIQPAPTSLPQDKSNTVIAGQSLTALIRLLSKPEVRTAVVAFQTDFEAASEQIIILADFKLVHDLFQELENRYFLIKNDERRLPADDSAWDNISLNEPELQGKINDLLNVLKRPTFSTDENRWSQQLEKARDQVRTGVEEFELSELKAGVHVIFRILNRQPSRINAQLVATANTLRLDNLEQAINTISHTLLDSGIGADNVIEEIKRGVGALAGLDERLNQLVREHNGWQDIDDELRRVEVSLSTGIEDLEDAWFDLEPMTRDMLNGTEQKWAADLDNVLTSLNTAINDRVDVTVKRLFRRFRSQVGRRFRQVDLELLTLCQDLQRVGESLDMLLRQFNK